MNNIHIVITGYDKTVLNEKNIFDTYARLCDYSSILNDFCPNSVLTYIVMSNESVSNPIQDHNLHIVPIYTKNKMHRLKLLKTLKQIHKENTINLITTQTIFFDGIISLIFAKKRSIPVVAQIHYDIFSKYFLRDIFKFTFLGHIVVSVILKQLKQYKAVRVVSNDIKQHIINNRYHQHVEVIPISTKRFEKTSYTLSNIERKTNLVIFVGRLVYAKNLNDWIEIAELTYKKDKNIRFKIIGQGALHSHLQKIIRHKGMEDIIELTGYIPYDEIYKYYAEATVFLLTSLYEGYGRVVIESYLSKLPVVATKTAGTMDTIIDGKTGYLCDIHDNTAIATKLLNLIHDSELREKFATEGYNYLRDKYGSKKVTTSWMEMLIRNTSSDEQFHKRRNNNEINS